MRNLFVTITLCLCLLLSAGAVMAAEDGYRVTYLGNNCLASVPEDETVYQKGETVTVLFEPVTYMNGLTFYGWDWNNDGITEFGYAYNHFTMPDHDVEMKAICISPYSYAPQPPQPPRPPQPPKPDPNWTEWQHGWWDWTPPATPVPTTTP